MARLNARLRRARREYSEAVEAQSGYALQLKLRLSRIQPPIWRRFLVPAALEARHLSRVFERVMGWSGAHLSSLHFPRPAGSPARRLLVGERLKVGDRLAYWYDSGDGWRHEAIVEERLERAVKRPLVVSGARACPPEDCGGVSRYEGIVAMLAEPDGRRDLERLRWLEEVHPGWTPEAFDEAAINRRLSRMRLSG